jgi:cell division transport system permease protein
MMRKLRRASVSFTRVIKSGMVSFFRNWWLSIAAASIMLVTLLIVGTTFLFNRAVNDTLADLALDLPVSVYLLDEAPDAQVEQLQSVIESDDNVARLTFISKEQARQDYLAENDFSEELIDAVGIVGNTLPSSFEVQLEDLSRPESFIDIIERDDFSDVVESYNTERLTTAQGFGDFQDSVVVVGFVVAGVFTAISVLVIFNTIRMAIFSRREEIRMMKLIGATKNFIRGPFLVESSMYGVIAGAIASTIFYFVMRNAPDTWDKLILVGAKDLVANNIIEGTLALMLGGVIIGVFSSLMAMARHLRLSI